MNIFLASFLIIMIRIVTSAFAGDMRKNVKLVFRLTSYFGMALAAVILTRFSGTGGGLTVLSLTVILASLLFTFVLKKSIAIGNALEIAMSGLLVCLTSLVFISIFELYKNTGLCFISSVGFYDLWFMSVISLEHEERHKASALELTAAGIITCAAGAAYGFLIYIATFYALLGISNFLSILTASVMILYIPVAITVFFIRGEKNNKPFENPFEAYRRRRAQTRAYRNYGESYMHWDYEGNEQRYDWGREESSARGRYGRSSAGQQREERGKQAWREYGGNTQGAAESSVLSDEVKHAMKIYGIRDIGGLNKELLDKKRRQLMKRYHPDAGRTGNTEKAGEINAAYDLLKRYTR